MPTFNLLCEEHEGTLELQKFSGRTRVFFQGILSKNTTFLFFSLSSNSIVFIDRGRKKQQAVKAVSNVLSTTTIRFHVFDGQVCQMDDCRKVVSVKEQLFSCEVILAGKNKLHKVN